MPCSDSHYETREEVLQKKMPAVLCAIVGILGPDEIVDKLDWQEAGVTPAEFREWWRLHQRRDQARRAAEEEYRRKQEARATAIAKLTPEERAALGIK